MFKVRKPRWAKVEAGHYQASLGSTVVAEAKRIKHGKKPTLWKLTILIDIPYIIDLDGNVRDGFRTYERLQQAFTTCYNMRKTA